MNLFQKLEKIALDKNVSLAEIRDCIGKHYFYDIKSGGKNIPVFEMEKLFKLLKADNKEKIWLYGLEDNSEKTELSTLIQDVKEIKKELLELKANKNRSEKIHRPATERTSNDVSHGGP